MRAQQSRSAAHRLNLRKTAVGFRAHTGWAAAVSVSLNDGTAPVVVDRRRIDLRDRRFPGEIYHAARAIPLRRGEKLIINATAATRAVARTALMDIKRDLRAAGYDLVATGVVLGNGRLMLPLEQALSSHAGSHAAEGELYRQALIGASESLRLPAIGIPESLVYEQGAAALSLPVSRVAARVAELGVPLGAPWTQDQKTAAVLAWCALREASRSGRAARRARD